MKLRPGDEVIAINIAENATTVTTVDARTYRQSTASIVRDQMHALRDLRLG